ncbi:hypothetical protein GCM10009845_29330 [Pedococcus bigeumensis]
MHDRHLVGEGQRLRLVVRDEDDRDPLVVERLRHRLPRGGAQAGVEGGEGFVEDDETRSGGEGAGDGDALLLPARQLVGAPAHQPGVEPEEAQELGDPLGVLAFGPGEAEGHVVGDRQVREEVALLRHVADPPALRGRPRPVAGHRLVVEEDRPGSGRLEPGDHPQQGRLATAGRTEDRGGRARGDDQVDAVQHLVAPVGGAHAADEKRGHRSGSSSERCSSR